MCLRSGFYICSMPRPDFEHLKQIKQIVESRLKPGARVWVHCLYRGTDPELAYIAFNYTSGNQTPQTVTHEPGIPLPSLVPEKTQRIADWICAQVGKSFPDWFSSSHTA